MIRTALVAFAIALTPSLGLAQACDHGDQSAQTMSCAVGQAWDKDLKACVPVTS